MAVAKGRRGQGACQASNVRRLVSGLLCRVLGCQGEVEGVAQNGNQCTH